MARRVSTRTAFTVIVALLFIVRYVLISWFMSSHRSAPGYQWDHTVRKQWVNTSFQAKQRGIASSQGNRGNTLFQAKQRGITSSQAKEWDKTSVRAKERSYTFQAKRVNTSSQAKEWDKTSFRAKEMGYTFQAKRGNTSSQAKWGKTSSQAKWGKTPSQSKEEGYASPQTQHLVSKSSQAALPKSLTFFFNSSLQSRKVSSRTSTELKTIVFFNSLALPCFKRMIGNTHFTGCDVSACVLTDNETEREKADAVVFFMCKNLTIPLPFKPAQHQVWIAFGLEPPWYCRYYRNPYQRRFNWTMTHRTDSDVFAPYGLFRLRQPPAEKNYTAIVSGKSKPVAWFVSNCHDRCKRQEYAAELNKHIPVDIYGRCGSFTCPKSGENDCKRLLNTTYFFYLSFENSLCRDYMTEKVFKLYNNVDVIPVVRGGADYDRYLPPGTFLNTADFPTPRALAVRLNALMADTQAYAEMLKLKDKFAMAPSPHWCKLCQKLHENSGTKTYPDLEKWASQGICRDAEDV